MFVAYLTLYLAWLLRFGLVTSWECPGQAVTQNSDNTFHDFPLPQTMLFDVPNKLVMDWTPKAACTQSVVMFFDHMGLRHGIEWHEAWPHKFRQKFYTKCGHATGKMLRDASWFKFKMVRNPFERAVSIYTHIMHHHETIFDPKHVKVEQPWSMSFRSFLSMLQTEVIHNPDLLYTHDFGGGHARHQHNKFDLAAYKGSFPPVFDAIIHVEKAQLELDAMQKRLGGMHGGRFNWSAYTDFRHEEKHDDVNYFVGDISYQELLNVLPSNYKYFYDEDIRKKVEEIYHWDLVLYGYSFQFTERKISHV